MSPPLDELKILTMNRLLKHSLLLLSIVASVGVSAQTKTETIRFADYGAASGTNLSDISALSNLESVKLSFYANGAESAPKYYSMGARFYVGNAMTIKAKENIVVNDIVVNYVYKVNITDNASASFSNCTYEYDNQGPFGIISHIAGDVSMTNTSSHTAEQGNQVWISSLTITYHEVQTEVMNPVISSSKGQLFKQTNTISISCPTEGAQIYYNTNCADDPDQNSTLYQGPFTIDESTVVRAMAVSNGKTSMVVYKEFFYAPIPDNVDWYESFDNVNGVGGNDGIWQDLFDLTPLEGTDKEWLLYDDEHYEGDSPRFNKVYSGNQCAIIGSGGSLVIKHINITGNGKMYFWAESMGQSADAVTVRIDARPFDGYALGEGEVCGNFIGNGSTVTVVNNNTLEYGDCDFSIATVKPLSKSGRFTLFELRFERMNLTDRITISFPQGHAGFIDEVYFVLDEPETVDVTFTDLLFTTIYYSKMGFIVPQGIRAYHFGIDQNTLKIEKEFIFKPGEVIPQGMAVVLKADNPGTYTFKEAYASIRYWWCWYQRGYDEEAMTDSYWNEYGDPYDNNLVFYRLRTKNNTVGFFFSPGCPEGEPFICPAHESFFVVPLNMSNHYGYPIASLSTDIEGIIAENDDDDKDILYNLNGQRVDCSYRGVVISKGKKWLNK